MYMSLQPFACGVSFFSFSKNNRWTNSLGHFCHVPLKRDQLDWDVRIRLNDTTNAKGCGISSFPNRNWWSRCLGLFCHVPWKRDQCDWDWNLRLNDTPNAIGCMHTCVAVCHACCSVWYACIHVCVDVYKYVHMCCGAVGCTQAVLQCSRLCCSAVGCVAVQ